MYLPYAKTYAAKTLLTTAQRRFQVRKNTTMIMTQVVKHRLKRKHWLPQNPRKKLRVYGSSGPKLQFVEIQLGS